MARRKTEVVDDFDIMKFTVRPCEVKKTSKMLVVEEKTDYVRIVELAIMIFFSGAFLAMALMMYLVRI